MQYREYGKTGKKVSVVGMGGMRFRQADYADGNLDRCAAVVHRAFERGINYFDTAPGYCDDKSEAIFGRAFPNHAERPVLCVHQSGPLARSDRFGRPADAGTVPSDTGPGAD